jgi:hypothetical protein
VLNYRQDIKWRMPEHVFRAVIVDGEANVVLLDEGFEARKLFERGVAGDDHTDAGALGVLEFGADVCVIIL